MKTPLLLLALLLPACGYTQPTTITVDPGLPEGLQEAVGRAQTAWCAVSDQTGWCPALVDSGGDAEVRVGHFPDEAIGGDAHTDGWLIEVSPRVAEAGADDLDGVMAHEFGHVGGINSHVKRSALMHAKFPTMADIPCEVDTLAVVALCDQMGNCK